MSGLTLNGSVFSKFSTGDLLPPVPACHVTSAGCVAPENPVALVKDKLIDAVVNTEVGWVGIL